jgi:hypothetical protein
VKKLKKDQKNKGKKGRFTKLEFPSFLSILITQIYVLTIAKKHLPDLNWDSQNTYTYSAFQFIDNRYSKDWLVGGLNGYNPPFLQIPSFILSSQPVLYNLIFVGLTVFITQVFLFNICLMVLNDVTKHKEKIKATGGRSKTTVSKNRMLIEKNQISLISTFMLLSPLFLSEVGTTMGDSLSMLLLFLGLYLYLKSLNGNQTNLQILAGFIFATATFLKLVNSIFLLALVVTALVMTIIEGRHQVKRLGALFAGIVIGFVVSLPWYVSIYKLTGNPIFPYFNAIFKSKYYVENNPRDLRWEFNSIYELKDLALGKWGSNLLEFDAINYWWPVTIVLCCAFLILRIKKLIHLKVFTKNNKLISTREETSIPSPSVTHHFVIFLGLSLLIWIKFFFYARYAMFIEILLPLVSFLIIYKLFPLMKGLFPYFLIVATACTIFMQVPNWNLYQSNDSGSQIDKASLTKDYKWGIRKSSIPINRADYIIDGECSCTFVIPSFNSDSTFLRLDPEIYGWVRTFPRNIQKKIENGSYQYLISRGNSEEDFTRLNKLLASIKDERKLNIAKVRIIETVNGQVFIYPLSNQLLD